MGPLMLFVMINGVSLEIGTNIAMSYGMGGNLMGPLMLCIMFDGGILVIGSNIATSYKATSHGMGAI